MPLRPEPDIDLDSLMAKIRVEVARRRGGQDLLVRESNDPPMAALHHTKLLLDQAGRVSNIGTTVPPFGVFGPVRRWLARGLTRVLYYVLQVVTVDQRVFNGLVLNALRSIVDELQRSESRNSTRARDLQTQLTASARDLEAQITTRTRDLEAQLATRLADLEAQLATRLADLEAQLATRSADLEAQLATRSADLETQLATRLGDLDGRTRELEGQFAALEAAIDAGRSRMDESIAHLTTSLALQERRLARLLEASATSGLPAKRSEVFADERLHLLDRLYASLEERFRGTRDDIKDRVRVYLPTIREARAGTEERPILDVGCGRGEWLEVLREEGLCARGIERNESFLRTCREAGFVVIESDAIAALRALPEQSVGAVTALHVIEHLSREQLIELLDETVRVLQSGGVAIFESPNPENLLVGACTFYLDPTHRRPVPSALARFLAEARGLARVEVMPLHPCPESARLRDSDVAERINTVLYGPRDYAVLGFKA